MLDGMVAAGLTPAAVAATTGLSRDAARGLMSRHRQGRDQLQHRTVRALLTATDRPTQGEVSAVGAARRLQALARAGWSTDDLIGLVGNNLSGVSRLRSGRQERLTAAWDGRIRRAYRAALTTPGPSPKAAEYAAAQGWAGAGAWEDDPGPHCIDDPAATPSGVRVHDPDPRRTDIEDRAERVREMHAFGWSDARIAQKVGCTARTVHRIRQRLGLPAQRDLLAITQADASGRRPRRKGAA